MDFPVARLAVSLSSWFGISDIFFRQEAGVEVEGLRGYPHGSFGDGRINRLKS
jgi:hypothetical protein